MAGLLPHIIASDALVRFDALSQLLGHGRLTSTAYSLIGPVFSAPLWYLGHAISKTVEMVSEYNTLLFAAGVLFFWWTARDVMDGRTLRTFILLLITASMFGAAVQDYYGDTFTAVGVGFGVAGAILRSRWRASWAPVILGVANTPAAVIGLIVMVVKLLWDRRRARYVILIAAAAGLILGEDWLRRGSALTTGYEGNRGFVTVMPFSGLPGFSNPFWFGLLSILFSFGKGLIFFAPGLLLPVGRALKRMGERPAAKLRSLYSLWVAFLVGLVIVYSSWWAWYGGVAWGPRFFLFASIPASFAIAVQLGDAGRPLRWTIATLGILCLSAWVGLDGALYASTQVVTPSVCDTNHFALENLCWFTPDFSVLWYPFIAHLPPGQVSPRRIVFAVYSIAVFLYLALPLLADLVRDLRRRGASIRADAAHRRAFRW
jgi:hypothetical protein